jgi:hypothetical protein
MKPQIIPNGHCTHLVIDDQSPEAIALVEAIFAADQLVRKEVVTSKEVSRAHDMIAKLEAHWCRAHGMKHDRVILMALARLTEKLHRHEARHATA